MFYEVHDGEDFFEPRFEAASLDDVRSDVSGVRREYGDCLTERDSGREELESLAILLERERNPRAAAFLAQELIEKVQSKMKLAAEELQRFDDESFAASNTTGNRAARLSKAAAALMPAKERLRAIAENA